MDGWYYRFAFHVLRFGLSLIALTLYGCSAKNGFKGYKVILKELTLIKTRVN